MGPATPSPPVTNILATMLTLDYANCLADRVGPHGLTDRFFAAASQATEAMTESLEQTRGTGWERWRGLPFDPMRSEHLGPVTDLAARLRGRFDTMLVLGIGGSALGNIALHSALNSPKYNLLPNSQRPGPRLFVLDNVDPVSVNAALDVCRGADGTGLKRTLVNVVSKSGETAETAAQFLILRELLGEALGASASEHVVAITDPAKGTMRSICEIAGYTTLPVPEGVGGRFSVLSPVGLFSAAMCGIDIKALLDGAAEMDTICSRPDLLQNPAAMLASLLCHLGCHTLPDGTPAPKTNHVMMPYANGLYLMADWFRQLWAESLGKRVDTSGNEVFAGYTPIKALGATDQHSQVQLYREGPNDKVFGFLEVADFGTDVTVPAGAATRAGAPDALGYLEGKSLATLLNAEKRATEFAFLESERPNFTIGFPRVDAYHIGQFVSLWQIATAYAGRILRIDAYDQPAVETGKKATFGLMGRPGYDEWLSKVAKRLAPTNHRIG